MVVKDFPRIDVHDSSKKLNHMTSQSFPKLTIFFSNVVVIHSQQRINGMRCLSRDYPQWRKTFMTI